MAGVYLIPSWVNKVLQIVIVFFYAIVQTYSHKEKKLYSWQSVLLEWAKNVSVFLSIPILISFENVWLELRTYWHAGFTPSSFFPWNITSHNSLGLHYSSSKLYHNSYLLFFIDCIYKIFCLSFLSLYSWQMLVVFIPSCGTSHLSCCIPVHLHSNLFAFLKFPFYHILLVFLPKQQM